jgi:hypothetical protein
VDARGVDDAAVERRHERGVGILGLDRDLQQRVEVAHHGVLADGAVASVVVGELEGDIISERPERRRMR